MAVMVELKLAVVVGDGEVAMVVEVGEAVTVVEAVVDAAVEVEDNSLCEALPVILVLYI